MVITVRLLCLLDDAQADKLEEEGRVEGDAESREEEVENQISILLLF